MLISLKSCCLFTVYYTSINMLLRVSVYSDRTLSCYMYHTYLTL